MREIARIDGKRGQAIKRVDFKGKKTRSRDGSGGSSRP